MTRVAHADTPPQSGWDIHCHTVYSDGTETPETLVAEAVRRGLHGVAIADHDTTAGWQEADILPDYEQMCSETAKIARGDEAVLKIGYLRRHNSPEVNQALAEFSARYPLVDIQLLIWS